MSVDPKLSPGEGEPVTISVTEEELTMAPRQRLVHEHLDGIQHGLDDDPNNDPAKGSVLGATGGAVVGAVAGAVLGPVGAALGALAGAAAGAIASGLAVAAVDSVDNDDNITGLGAEVSVDADQFPPEPVQDLIREKQDR
ncbi:Blp family class II bacteriocin [Armatimonas rosea]|uniref:Phage tail tape-measure protein n=1 Tax=Armatimonas rosea TaxID=685828 RepID=A0A7W9SVB4_ARMRO|nr:Blp family class II bacteriocin [Armatimonas rosea]MBB6053516.1 phage tail tape-measure protein [Armatimonas rosea]